VQGKGVGSSFEATITETERTTQGYSNYSRGSIQIPSEYKPGWPYFVVAVTKTKNKTIFFINTHCPAAYCEKQCDGNILKGTARNAPFPGDCALG